MGEVCSRLSEGKRRVIQIEVGDGTSVRKMARLLGRGPSGISREIKRNTWVPVRRERVLPAVPAETAEDRPVDGRMLHRRPRAAQGRPQARQAAQAPPPVMRTPVGAGGRMAGSRLVAAARRRQAARPVPRRPRHARVPGDRPPLGLRRPPSPWAPGAPPSTRQQEAAQAWRREDVAFPDSRTGSHLRASAGGRRSQRFRPLGGRQRDRRRMRPAHRGREEDQVPHGRDRAR